MTGTKLEDLPPRNETKAPRPGPVRKRGTASVTSGAKPTGSPTKKPNHVDRHVGKRVRLRRSLLGLSQEELARLLAITAQQIQKYETGETRVSASRLYEIAQQLGVPITWFFQELEDTPPGRPAKKPVTPAGRGEATHIADLMGRREARDIVQAYFNIPDERLRRKLLQMASLLTKDGEP